MSIFNKKAKPIDNEESVQKETSESSKADGIRTALSYHPDWELSVQEKYVFQYNHQKLPLMQPNQISVHGINLYEYEDGFVVSAFLSSSLPKPVTFEVIDLVIINEENETLARKSFEMDLFGELLPNTTMPWRFLFNKENQLVEKMPKKGWRLVFELKQKVVNTLPLELEKSWEDSLNEQQKEHLNTIIQQLPPLKNGEINFLGLEATQNHEKAIAITLLIRNASNRSITIENLPLILEDASGEAIAKASFALDKLEIRAFTCKPWTFVFPATAIAKESPDLSKWKAYVPQ